MIRTTTPRQRSILSRSLFGAALALGLASGSTMLAAPAMAAPKAPAAPKLSLSKPFQALAGPLQQAIERAKTKPEVVAAVAKVTAANDAARAAQGNAARTAANAQRSAALAELGAAITVEKSQLDGAFAAVTNQDDRYVAGQFSVTLGGLAQDSSLQYRGLSAMLESGKVAPADAPRLHFFTGSLAYDLKNYASARTSLAAAIAGGYRENDVDALLAEAYIADNQVPQGLTILSQAIEQHKAAGTPAPQNWYRRGLGAAYKAKLLDQVSGFSMALVRDYPNNDNWAGAITVLREIAQYPSQDALDLMRLMGRTNSYAEERDYVEYIQSADARRLPGEVLNVISAGIAAGKLKPADLFVTEAKGIASSRVAADKASLPGFERDARAANATGATAAAAADAFLSYGEAGKAVELYNIALGKTGVDQPRALTRLGIAQVDAGDFAGAQATFAKVTGPRKAMAQLWTIYAQQKAATPR